MAATVWKGQLTFGLVSIPVRLVRAARAEKVSMHQLYRGPREPAVLEQAQVTPPRIAALNLPAQLATPPSKVRSMPRPQEPEPEVAPVTRVRQSAIAPDQSTPIPRSELLKGYEYTKDQYVVIDEEDIRRITPQTAAEMQIVEFVRFAEIDPVYLETSYYMIPGEAGEKAYTLLFEGMRESGYVALTQVAMHRREHVMILRPGKTGIITHTMFYPDEVRTIEEFRTNASILNPKELTLSRALIETLAAPFEPAKFKDTYRERLHELIEAKVQGKELAPLETAPAGKVVDIMDALQQSLAALTAKKEGEQAPRKAASSERPAAKERRRRGQ